MRIAGIAGALAMLGPCLVGCGGGDETQLEPDVRSYIESNQLHDRVLALPDNVSLDDLACGKVRPLDLVACEITVSGARGGQYLVVRTVRGAFAIRREGTAPRG